MLMKTFLGLSQDGLPPSSSANPQNSWRLKTCRNAKCHRFYKKTLESTFTPFENAQFVCFMKFYNFDNSSKDQNGLINWGRPYIPSLEWVNEGNGGMLRTNVWWKCNREEVLDWRRRAPKPGEASGSQMQEPHQRSPWMRLVVNMFNCPRYEDASCVHRGVR